MGDASLAPDSLSRSEDPDPIDRAYLSRFTLGDRSLECEVLELFAAHARGQVEQLRSAQTVTDWKRAAHAIKSSAAAVGAWRVARVAGLAEGLDLDSAATSWTGPCAATADAMAQAVEEACAYIARSGATT
jgi:HPt (histidine-containing phosphotransfer) domain-containing protein